MSLLGERVPLKGFTGFRGGLDVVENQTGDTSVYTRFADAELMFHVNTLLPYTKGDNQQVRVLRACCV